MARTVLVTGCSSGFGHAMISRFLRDGWSVVATARRASARRHLFAEALAAHPTRLSLLDLDVTVEAERLAALESLRARPGRLDCLVNNAGRAVFGALEDLAPAELREQIEVNYLGPALLTRELLPLLRSARGRIICISSMFGETGFALSGAYSAAKFALEGLAEALRHEMAPHGVQVALVEPGRFRTAFAENARWGESSFAPSSPYLRQSRGYAALKARLAAGRTPGPDVVADAVVRLASQRRMPLRVRVGADVRAVHAARRLLPERAWVALWGAICSRALAAKTRPVGPGAREA